MENVTSIQNLDRLHRVFDLLVFDWDGTAVRDRTGSAARLSRLLQELLESRAICVIITGTKVENILKQGVESLSTVAKQNLYLCTNRGSEVYGFDAKGGLQNLYHRQASEAENRALDEAARRLQKFASGFGLETNIISNRLNRRKIDLIPVPRWSDPKKSEFRELLVDVQERLKTFGISDGLSGLIDNTIELAHDAGLPSPKVTSDIKHIEIGLTDKADSINWIADNIVSKNAIPHDRIIFFGDEFGTIGGVSGSDTLMRVPELKDVHFATVGVEPESVPAWVISLGGGPDRFLGFLEEQVHLRKRSYSFQEQPYKPDPSWHLELEGFDPTREREMETLFAIGNGYLGVRAAASFPIPASQEDLFISGIYDQKAVSLPYSETKFLTNHRVERPDVEIVPFPYPFRIRLFVDHKEVAAGHTNMPEHGRILNFKTATYTESHRFVDEDGKNTHIRITRRASVAIPHLLVQEITVTSKNYSGELMIDLSSHSPERDPEYPHIAIEPITTPQGLSEVVVYTTQASASRVVIASRIFVNAKETFTPTFSLKSQLGEPTKLLKVIAVFTNCDSGDPLQEAKTLLSSLQAKDLIQDLEQHSLIWDEFWKSADVTFEGRPEVTQAQRFNSYHLRIAVSQGQELSVPAKALTGRAYEGHIFWDSEIFMFPFFLHTDPKLAKSLLLYRYRTLDGARKRAAAMGFKGACFAWESTLSGEDVTPESITIKESGLKVPIFTGSQQIHVTADIAFAVWRYWDATLDDPFILNYGAEILLETARFWASRLRLRNKTYHLDGVIGPDEYHHHVNDNFFTNWMARFNLKKACEILGWMQTKYSDRYTALAHRFQIELAELSAWRSIAKQVFIPQPNKDGIFEQFDGFFRLRDVTLSPEERMIAPIQRIFHWEEVNQSKLIKQADVLMIPFLFPKALTQEKIRRNFQYYEPKTDHGSSLSLCVHAAIAARAGDWRTAEDYWEKSLNLDLLNSMSNTELGIHAGAMGGTWQALIFHLLGIEFGENGLVCNQASTHWLPRQAHGLTLNLLYRGASYPIRISREGRIAA